MLWTVRNQFQVILLPKLQGVTARLYPLTVIYNDCSARIYDSSARSSQSNR